ncbi:unnamed protein product [Cuscuta campestris]|uniref:Uncharacterized protein n=1 Tax=Cuscuta campestris TaxID=132261 RepID=A0A484N018_9ASTE|nr:unnamed protein product [Cuscuta campestris]
METILSLRPYHFHWQSDNHNALTVASFWAPVFLIYLLDTHLFYTIISSICGFLLGQRNVLERFDLWMLFKNFLRDFLLLLWIPFMFPLALEIFLAKDTSIEGKESRLLQEELWDRILRDDYMKYAVQECYYTLKLVLTSVLDTEGKKWVERIYDEIQRSIANRSILVDIELNKLPLRIQKVFALLGILDKSRAATSGKSKSKSQVPTSSSEERLYYSDGSYLWFDSEEERTRFLTFFSKRVVAPQRIIPERYPELQGYDDLDAQLHQAGLWPFVSRARKEINPALIRAFYSNLRREDGVLYSLVKSTPIELTVEQLGRIAGLPFQGDNVSHYGGEDWVLNNEGLILNELGITELIRHASGRPTIHSANPDGRLLLYIVSRIIKPRKHGHTIMSALKAQVEYLAKEVAKLTKIKLNALQGIDHDDDASTSGINKTRAPIHEGSDFKVDIPTFEGKNDPDESLEWLETVERVFDFKYVSDEKKVKIVALKFCKYASTWWTNTCTKRRRDELKAQVEYLAKEVAKLTKFKLSMVQTPEESEDEDDASSVATIRARNPEKSTSDFKVDMPTFEGKNDPDDFLEWLETVERVFDFKNVSEEKKVKLVALKFRKYASTWWTNVTIRRRRENKSPVTSWNKMRALLKKKFLPENHIRENFSKLQHLSLMPRFLYSLLPDVVEYFLNLPLLSEKERLYAPQMRVHRILECEHSLRKLAKRHGNVMLPSWTCLLIFLIIGNLGQKPCWWLEHARSFWKDIGNCHT